MISLWGNSLLTRMTCSKSFVLELSETWLKKKKKSASVQCGMTLSEQKTCLGHLRVWLESRIKLAPRWLITTFSLMPGKYAASLPGVSGEAENAAQAAS